MTPSMSTLDTPFFQEIPENVGPLFHYTDAGGLLGMVQYKKLWLTSIHYQNDSQEYYYAFDLVKEILEKHYPGLLQYSEVYSREKTSTVFTFSLSERKDLLSQWRGYCPDGGFAISFNKSQLNELVASEDILVAKCIYDKKEQISFIIDNVIEFRPEYYMQRLELEKDPLHAKDMQIFYFNKQIFNKITRIAPLLKDCSFSEEQEWRLIKVLQTSSDAQSLGDSVKKYIAENTVKIRARKNKLIPYIELPLNRCNNEPVAISEIVISPTPHKELALDACNALLFAESRVINHGVKIKNSKIPYINW